MYQPWESATEHTRYTPSGMLVMSIHWYARLHEYLSPQPTDRPWNALRLVRVPHEEPKKRGLRGAPASESRYGSVSKKQKPVFSARRGAASSLSIGRISEMTIRCTCQWSWPSPE